MARGIAVADCETDPFRIGRVPKPFAWGFFDGTLYRHFDTTKRFVEFISELPVILYAHNGGKFDWHFLLPHFNPYDELMIINGRISRAMIGKCELRDSYNIIPVPLAAYKKEQVDYDIFEIEERNKPKNRKIIAEYLRSDCMNLYELVSKFIELYGVQITQASAAMAQWKKLSRQKMPQTTKEFYDAFSPYYYGGRVQCFDSGIIKTDFSVYDINSAYPYAMQQKHPYSGEFTKANKYVPNADFYTLECRSSGAFPFRGNGNPDEGAGLCFPSDRERRTYFITGWEYAAAIVTGAISDVRIRESVTFHHHVDFSEYIAHFYQMRMLAKAQKDEAGSLFAKLLMNSLYGKFAANPENYRNYMVLPIQNIGGLAAQGWSFAGELGPWALAAAPLKEEQLRYYNVATGASITGYVRAMLWRAIASSKGVLYCDTDSIAVRQKGIAVQLGDKLGQWKFEGTFDKAGIGGKKLYVFQSVPVKSTIGEFNRMKREGHRIELVSRSGASALWRTFKIASKGARLTMAEIWKVAAGGIVAWTSEAPKFSAVAAPDFDKLPRMTQDEVMKKFFTTRKIRHTAAKT